MKDSNWNEIKVRWPYVHLRSKMTWKLTWRIFEEYFSTSDHVSTLPSGDWWLILKLKFRYKKDRQNTSAAHWTCMFSLFWPLNFRFFHLNHSTCWFRHSGYWTYMFSLHLNHSHDNLRIHEGRVVHALWHCEWFKCSENI